jgi:hypothetical protein
MSANTKPSVCFVVWFPVHETAFSIFIFHLIETAYTALFRKIASNERFLNGANDYRMWTVSCEAPTAAGLHAWQDFTVLKSML